MRRCAVSCIFKIALECVVGSSVCEEMRINSKCTQGRRDANGAWEESRGMYIGSRGTGCEACLTVCVLWWMGCTLR